MYTGKISGVVLENEMKDSIRQQTSRCSFYVHAANCECVDRCTVDVGQDKQVVAQDVLSWR